MFCTLPPSASRNPIPTRYAASGPPVCAEGLERRTLLAAATVTLTVVNGSGSEQGPQDAVLAVNRTGGDLSTPLTVRLTSTGISATPWLDYEPPSNSVTIPAGASWTHVPVRILADDVVEADESLRVELTTGPNYVMGQSRIQHVFVRDPAYIRPDWLEPENEIARDAKTLGPVTGEGIFQSLSIHQRGDVDFHRFTPTPGDVPTSVLVRFNHARGDLNIAVFNDVGTRELARSTGTGDFEHIVIPADPGETFLVKVWGEAGAVNNYSLDLRPLPAAPFLYLRPPVPSLRWNDFIFPAALPGKQREAAATFINIGAAPLDIGAATVPEGFEIVDPLKSRLEPGESDVVTIRSKGVATPGIHEADLTFATNDPAFPQVALHLIVPAYGVAARQFLYNNSALDRNTPQFTGSDAAAIDPSKSGLLPGETPTAANVSNYAKGINGVALTVVRPAGRALTPEDFELRVAKPGGTTWTAAPASVNVLAMRSGFHGAYHVSLIWPDYDPANPFRDQLAAANGWLEVTMKANEFTGLDAPDVAIFGNLIGDTGDGPPAGGGAGAPVARVNALDLAAVKRMLNTTSTITGRHDLNRDGQVNALDLGIVKANLNRTLADPPPPGVMFGAGRLPRDEDVFGLLL